VKVLCYVLGCDPTLSPVIVGTRHRLFGLVVSCSGHDPIRHGYAAPLVDTLPVPVPVVQRRNPDAGGLPTARKIPAPIFPPAGAAARPF
jgi:hypothetical protein